MRELLEFDFKSELVHEFIDFQDMLYTSEKYIPSIKEALYSELTPQNPFFSFAKYKFFLLKEGGKTIARCLAFIDGRRTQDDAIVGNWGYFECIDDQDASIQIISACEEFLRQNGAEIAHGPMNLNIYNGYRLMTEGFSESPFITEPRNPEYYPKLLMENGYKEEDHWRSWEISKPELSKFHNFVKTISTKRKDIHSLQFKSISAEDLPKALDGLYETALDVFSQNYGYSKISKQEFIAYFSSLGPLLDKNSFQIVYNQSGNPVAFVYGLRDFAPALTKINGDYSRLTEALSSTPERYIYHTFGVIKDLRFSDITARLSYAQTSNFADKYESSIAALTTSKKSIIDRIKKPNRRYIMLSKKL